MRFNPGAVIRRATTIGALALGAVALTAGPASATASTSTSAVLIATPGSVPTGSTTQLTATIYAGNVVATAAGGTVTMKIAGAAIDGCTALPVVNGTATCTSPVFPTVDFKRIDVAYSGNSPYEPSNGYTWLSIYGPASIEASVAPNVVDQRAAITYKANVVGAQLTSTGDVSVLSPPQDLGTVAFFVDGVAVPACAAQPVSAQGLATCSTSAPAVKGAHKLKTSFSGVDGAGPASATAPFTVLAPEVTVAATDFGSLTVGATSSRTVTVTNTGDSALKFGTVAVTGPFTVVGGTCVDAKLAAGATCTLELAFTPAAAGAHTGALTLNHNAGDGVTTVALSGTAVAAAAPVPPVSTPPAKPATLDPAKKPTFTVSVPSGDGAKASQVPTLKLPLSCPALTECELNGKLTIEQSALVNGKAKSSAAATTTVAKFSKVQVQAGGLKTVKLELSAAFIKSAQKKGIRRIRATLTINTVLGSGEKLTTAQRITIVIPKAAKQKVAAKQQVKPKFTG
ncbi:choice-of-anchor D domain-containing protein [Solirubrobacter phytolaccae]|uniref:Choice-of-anchor D domain-containing protein n=1 Tax=Solirubrobacter phytolaccae TaxID=1404360 RepID=A0A9X3NEX2_9ACTN|nr:choice-of-anchor D domain-containing protein [Solirubrobacter phytolaccae]MDA0185248.1 choice-of-anchor D domain-containing protein [Solirubrobacter phytolaccae]